MGVAPCPAVPLTLPAAGCPTPSQGFTYIAPGLLGLLPGAGATSPTLARASSEQRMASGAAAPAAIGVCAAGGGPDLRRSCSSPVLAGLVAGKPVPVRPPSSNGSDAGGGGLSVLPPTCASSTPSPTQTSPPNPQPRRQTGFDLPPNAPLPPRDPAAVPRRPMATSPLGMTTRQQAKAVGV